MPHLWCFSLSVLCLSFLTFVVKNTTSNRFGEPLFPRLAPFRLNHRNEYTSYATDPKRLWFFSLGDLCASFVTFAVKNTTPNRFGEPAFSRLGQIRPKPKSGVILFYKDVAPLVLFSQRPLHFLRELCG
jgi:hypothetical protein